MIKVLGYMNTLVEWAYLKLLKEFEDRKGVIRIRKWKDKQHNGQKKQDKRTNNNPLNKHIKLKIK